MKNHKFCLFLMMQSLVNSVYADGWCDIYRKIHPGPASHRSQLVELGPNNPLKPTQMIDVKGRPASVTLKEAAIDKTGVTDLLDELSSAKPNLKRIESLLDPNNVRNSDPRALAEKMLAIDQHLKNPALTKKARIDLLSIVDELESRPGNPLSHAMKTAVDACKLK